MSIPSEGLAAPAPARHTKTAHLCFALFWLKVSLAFSLAIGMLSYEIALVFQLRSMALSRLPKLTIPQLPAPTVNTTFTNVTVTSCVRDITLDALTSVAGSSTPAPALTGRLNPGPGGVWWGVDMDWAVDTPTTLVSRIRNVPAVVTVTLDVYAEGFDADTVIWKARETRRAGSMMHLKVVPGSPMELIGVEVLGQVAKLSKQINEEYGVAVFLNYGPEMNDASNLIYGMKPNPYITSFRTLTSLVRQHTNMTAMVWTPKSGLGYPSDRTVPYDDESIGLMDTNGNGFVDQYDDAYGPFYPGDEHVDWTGLSLPPSSSLPVLLQGTPTQPFNKFLLPVLCHKPKTACPVDPVHGVVVHTDHEGDAGGGWEFGNLRMAVTDEGGVEGVKWGIGRVSCEGVVKE
ncbi:hypothetical protein BC829DRAFT_495189 [Chytridium lagenaria]|nr:hypothetical protein BC829DRAFT_495189 [Chytridium lagenaria]